MARSKKKNIKRIGMLLVVLLLIGGGIGGSYYYKNFIYKNISFSDEEVFLFIPKNSKQSDVLKQIEDLELAQDMETLTWLADKKKLPGDLMLFPENIK